MKLVVKYINLYSDNKNTKIALWQRRYTKICQHICDNSISIFVSDSYALLFGDLYGR